MWIWNDRCRWRHRRSPRLGRFSPCGGTTPPTAATIRSHNCEIRLNRVPVEHQDHPPRLPLHHRDRPTRRPEGQLGLATMGPCCMARACRAEGHLAPSGDDTLPTARSGCSSNESHINRNLSLADRRDLDVKQAGGVDRPADHSCLLSRASCLDVDGERLDRDSGLVNRRRPSVTIPSTGTRYRTDAHHIGCPTRPPRPRCQRARQPQAVWSGRERLVGRLRASPQHHTPRPRSPRWRPYRSMRSAAPGTPEPPSAPRR